MRLKAVVVSLLCSVVALAPVAVLADIQPWNSCAITTNAATVCKTTFGVYGGISNNANVAQTATITCYDNASAASGTAIDTEAALGASQVVMRPAPGIKFANGITCLASATPTGNGFVVYFY